MNNHPSKKASAFMHTQHQDLHFILSKVNLLQTLNDHVSLYLDAVLKKHCQVGNAIGARLILITTNGSTATQIRFLIPDLLQKFQLDPVLKRFKEVQCKVRPFTPEKKAHSQPMRALSQENAEMMRATAHAIDDPILKEILMRIATRT